MTEEQVKDELSDEYYKLEAQIQTLHNEIQALHQAELAIQQARYNIESVSNDLVAQQSAISERILQRDREANPDFPL